MHYYYLLCPRLPSVCRKLALRSYHSSSRFFCNGFLDKSSLFSLLQDGLKMIAPTELMSAKWELPNLISAQLKHLICSLSTGRGLPCRSTRVNAVNICLYTVKDVEWVSANCTGRNCEGLKNRLLYICSLNFSCTAPRDYHTLLDGPESVKWWKTHPNLS